MENTAKKKYFSYCIVSRVNQEMVRDWVTVKVVDGGAKLENKNGVRYPIASFLKHRHFFHDEENPNFPT